MLAVFLDYSVLDHLQRIDAGTYAGKSESELRRLRTSAENRHLEIWISEITPVEMLHGLEKVSNDAAQRQRAADKDARKKAIAAQMFARLLGYPCSKSDDTFSRADISLRTMGPDWHAANSLQEKLLRVRGVSAGDVRQLVSCAFPFDGEHHATHPRLNWFVSEDRKLVTAVSTEIWAGTFPELAHLRFGIARDLIAAFPTLF